MEKPKKQTSKISLSINQSTGTWLNEALLPQHRYPSIDILDPNGEILAKIDMTFEQFAQFLVSNSHVTCTLSRYRTRDDKLAAEEVEQPETVGDRMTKRLGEYRENVKDRMKELQTDIYEMINGSQKINKKTLEKLYSDIGTIRSHFVSNENFAVQQAQEETSEIQESMRTQLLTFLSGKGLDVSKNDIKMLEGNRENTLQLTGEKAEAKVEPFEKKQRVEKPIDDMTCLELADNIHEIFKKLETQETSKTKFEDVKHTKLFSSIATATNKTVIVKYISYQKETSLTREEAAAYLKFLRTIGTLKEFKTHYWYNKKD